MQTYLIEYKTSWAGKVIKEGIFEANASSEYEAQKKTEEFLLMMNRKAEIQFGDIVAV